MVATQGAVLRRPRLALSESVHVLLRMAVCAKTLPQLGTLRWGSRPLRWSATNFVKRLNFLAANRPYQIFNRLIIACDTWGG